MADFDVDQEGRASVRRYRRRYVTRTRVKVEVLFDTRMEGLPPTNFDALELSDSGSQPQLDALTQFLEGQGLVPEPALEWMFYPDRGHVPTSSDCDQSRPNVQFHGEETRPGGMRVHWTVFIGATGHMRIMRETPLA